jgi:hypothetical protein
MPHSKNRFNLPAQADQGHAFILLPPLAAGPFMLLAVPFDVTSYSELSNFSKAMSTCHASGWPATKCSLKHLAFQYNCYATMLRHGVLGACTAS